jgi:hypothetical protein
MGSRPAFAVPHDAGPLDLEWIAPPGCPARDAVLDDVPRILGPKKAEAPIARVAARAVLFRGEDARWHVVITVSDEGAGERTLEASSCEEVTNAAAMPLQLGASLGSSSSSPSRGESSPESSRPLLESSIGAESLGNAGGAAENRTRDLLHAMQALSQLSYSPDFGGKLMVRTAPASEPHICTERRSPSQPGPRPARSARPFTRRP